MYKKSYTFTLITKKWSNTNKLNKKFQRVEYSLINIRFIIQEITRLLPEGSEPFLRKLECDSCSESDSFPYAVQIIMVMQKLNKKINI